MVLHKWLICLIRGHHWTIQQYDHKSISSYPISTYQILQRRICTRCASAQKDWDTIQFEDRETPIHGTRDHSPRYSYPFADPKAFLGDDLPN
jgi:hypothetical protein